MRKVTAPAHSSFVSCVLPTADTDSPPSAVLCVWLWTGADGWDEKVYRLNDAKVRDWLKAKVEVLRATLPTLSTFERATRTQRTPPSHTGRLLPCAPHSLTRSPSRAPPSVSAAESILLSALSFVGEYLTPDHMTPLLTAYHLTAADLLPQSKAASSSLPSEVVGADSATERAGGGGSAAAKAAKKTVSTAVKKLQQIDTKKMPSLMSLWGRKS